ncbi:MAG: hypothetical protein ACPGJS_12225 [Flammeovirgaceae bacterium]
MKNALGKVIGINLTIMFAYFILIYILSDQFIRLVVIASPILFLLHLVAILFFTIVFFSKGEKQIGLGLVLSFFLVLIIGLLAGAMSLGIDVI